MFIKLAWDPDSPRESFLGCSLHQAGMPKISRSEARSVFQVSPWISKKTKAVSELAREGMSPCSKLRYNSSKVKTVLCNPAFNQVLTPADFTAGETASKVKYSSTCWLDDGSTERATLLNAREDKGKAEAQYQAALQKYTDALHHQSSQACTAEAQSSVTPGYLAIFPDGRLIGESVANKAFSSVTASTALLDTSVAVQH